MSSVNFDGLFDRFSQQIYQSRKGRLRMQLIDALYRRYLPLTSLNEADVLDAAGGLGQMSAWFLSQGSRVNYFDVSEEMVQAVTEQFAQAITTDRLLVSCQSITQLETKDAFDLVNAHAVLEWLEQPYDALARLQAAVKPGGYLCLMVYNKHMLMLRHLMRGTMARAMAGEIVGDRKGLTPISPLDPNEVAATLRQSGFEVISQAGLRTFSDLAEKTVIDWYDESDVFESELRLCESRPYCDIGRYVLIIAKKADSPEK